MQVRVTGSAESVVFGPAPASNDDILRSEDVLKIFGLVFYFLPVVRFGTRESIRLSKIKRNVPILGAETSFARW